METQDSIFLLLGTNLGNRLENIHLAVTHINEKIGHIVQKSSLYETQAWGIEDQPSFFNQVIEISTTLPPEDLLFQINIIEAQMGRKRFKKWGERLIDIDILYYNQKIIQQPLLEIPHPGIPLRRFTLVPLKEIAPKFIHPVLQKNHIQLLKECKDPLQAKKM
jgi:2-amino-4-hydroxy-6-hydroxymethyldihydropteridine diphosphokinase